MTEHQEPSSGPKTGQELSQKRAGQFARIFYFLVVVFGITAEIIRSSIIVQNNAEMTAKNIRSSEFLFRASIVSDFLMIISFLFAGLSFYMVYRNRFPISSSIMILFVIISIPIHLLNMLNQYAAVLILTSDGYLSSFGNLEINSLVLLYLNLYQSGYLIAQIFFGAWLLPLSYMVYQSRYFPAIFGLFLLIGGLTMLLDTVLTVLIPEIYELFAAFIELIAGIGEVSFILWLLFRGVNIEIEDSNT